MRERLFEASQDRETQKLRQLSAQNTEIWQANKKDIMDEEGKYIGHMREPWLAGYVARLHNIFLPLTNYVMMLKKRLADSAIVAKDMMNDGDNDD